jgi:hypothetical protein
LVESNRYAPTRIFATASAAIRLSAPAHYGRSSSHALLARRPGRHHFARGGSCRRPAPEARKRLAGDSSAFVTRRRKNSQPLIATGILKRVAATADVTLIDAIGADAALSGLLLAATNGLHERGGSKHCSRLPPGFEAASSADSTINAAWRCAG